MDLGLVRERIGKPSGVRKVGGAASLASIKPGQVVTPALYIIPLREPADPPAFETTTIQRISSTFGIVYAIGSKRDSTGEAALDDLEPYRDSIRAALHGWEPPAPGYRRARYTGGQLLSMDDDVVYWLDEYAVDRYAN